MDLYLPPSIRLSGRLGLPWNVISSCGLLFRTCFGLLTALLLGGSPIIPLLNFANGSQKLQDIFSSSVDILSASGPWLQLAYLALPFSVRELATQPPFTTDVLFPIPLATHLGCWARVSSSLHEKYGRNEMPGFSTTNPWCQWFSCRKLKTKARTGSSSGPKSYPRHRECRPYHFCSLLFFWFAGLRPSCLILLYQYNRQSFCHLLKKR